MPPTDIASEHLDRLAAITGDKGVVTGDDRQPYLTEWRNRWPGESPLVLAPGSVGEVADIVRYCAGQRIGITPQGGNTGLVGGQMPQGEILITLKRLRAVRDVSPLSNTITVEAGVTLAETQAAAAAAGRLFPLSIGSEGTCQIGGAVSTNAGGVNVLRYGNMRDLVLGLEAVLPNGEIWDGLNALRKNNTGYDLKQLFIGGEGTLGIVTAATLKLYPRPRDQVLAFAAVPDVQSAVDLLSFMQEETGGLATSFELLSEPLVNLVLENFPDLQRPLAQPSAWYVLMEFSAGQEKGLREMIETALATAFERGTVIDATIAENETQAEKLWTLRHNAAPAMALDLAASVKCDVSVPIHAIPDFIADADAQVSSAAVNARIIAFGHIGDGNIHYDILGPLGSDQDAFIAQRPALQQAVHDVVTHYRGSISAEHGIGILKRDELKQRKSATELQMMRAVKQALDPNGIMNPGKLL